MYMNAIIDTKKHLSYSPWRNGALWRRALRAEYASSMMRSFRSFGRMRSSKQSSIEVLGPLLLQGLRYDNDCENNDSNDQKRVLRVVSLMSCGLPMQLSII